MAEKISFLGNIVDIVQIRELAMRHKIRFSSRPLESSINDPRLLVTLEGDEFTSFNAGCAEIFKIIAPSSPLPTGGSWQRRILD